MRPDLPITEAMKETFDRDGFVTMDPILEPATVQMLLERFQRVFDGEFETGLDPDERNWKKGREPEDHTRQICNGWLSDRYVARVSLDRAIGKACAQLGGWSGTRLCQDNLLWKPPGGKPIGFHQDSGYEDFIVPNEWVSCWIALDDTVGDGGTVEFIPGSHRWHHGGRIRQFHAPEDAAWDLREAATRERQEAFQRVPVITRAGGGTFHSGWTWHGSDVNRQPMPRRSLVIHCMPAEARFHPTNINRTYSRYKKFGELAMDESFFPVTWTEQGYRSPFIRPYLDLEIGVRN